MAEFTEDQGPVPVFDSTFHFQDADGLKAPVYITLDVAIDFGNMTSQFEYLIINTTGTTVQVIEYRFPNFSSGDFSLVYMLLNGSDSDEYEQVSWKSIVCSSVRLYPKCCIPSSADMSKLNSSPSIACAIIMIA